MVVPIERVSSINKSKKIVGNNQTVEFKENPTTIKVIGNNCQIKIQENEGCLKVIGDCCRITVDSGRGCINYIGNCGKIQLGEGVSESQVTYIGNGNEILKFVQNSCDSVPLQNPTKVRKNSEKRKCVNLNNKRALHIGHCQNIFVPLCHNHICIKIPDIENCCKKS